MDKEVISKIAEDKRLQRHTRKEMFDRLNETGDCGIPIRNDAILSNQDIAREEGIRLAVAFFRDEIGKEPDTDTIVDMVLQAYDDALRGSP